MPEPEKKETSDDKAKAELDELFGSGNPIEETGIPEGIPVPPGEDDVDDFIAAIRRARREVGANCQPTKRT